MGSDCTNPGLGRKHGLVVSGRFVALDWTAGVSVRGSKKGLNGTKRIVDAIHYCFSNILCVFVIRIKKKLKYWKKNSSWHIFTVSNVCGHVKWT